MSATAKRATTAPSRSPGMSCTTKLGQVAEAGHCEQETRSAGEGDAGRVAPTCHGWAPRPGWHAVLETSSPSLLLLRAARPVSNNRRAWKALGSGLAGAGPAESDMPEPRHGCLLLCI